MRSTGKHNDIGTMPAEEAGDDWRPLQPQTLVDLVIDQVISQAARGAVLPGDRIVEAELARKLRISRVPVREALRLLESQGIVINEPYKGIRLRPVTNRRVHDLVEARTALETSAAHRAVAARQNCGTWLESLRAAIAEMDLMASRSDSYGIAAADTNFHRALCKLGGNTVVLDLWEMLSRQSTIIFGLATLSKPMPAIVDEHRELVAVFERGDEAAIANTLHQHIVTMNLAVDYEAILDERRARRDAARAVNM